MLETKRLKLRNFKDTDIYELFDYRNNQLCAKYQRYDDKSEKALSEFIKRNKDQHFLSETEQHYAITLKTGELIGDVAIYFKKETITLGYTISYKHHRKGYAFEILSALVKSLHCKYLEYEIV
ncbi:MAG: GNAT family N-acetyltransferase, partial [Turicibacter sanguinis]